MSTMIDGKSTIGHLKATQQVANVALMADKKIIRIAVRPEAKRIIASWAKRSDMTEVGVASRIYQWFSEQPEAVQRTILGLFGGLNRDVAVMVLEQMAGRYKVIAEGVAETGNMLDMPDEADQKGTKPRGDDGGQKRVG